MSEWPSETNVVSHQQYKVKHLYAIIVGFIIVPCVNIKTIKSFVSYMWNFYSILYMCWSGHRLTEILVTLGKINNNYPICICYCDFVGRLLLNLMHI